MLFLRCPLIAPAALFTWVSLTLPAQAVVVTFQETGSYTTGITQIRSDQTGNNYGADGNLIVGRTTAPATIRGLLSFSLASIPAGSTINSIKLTLVTASADATSSSGAAVLNLYNLNGAFVEGTGTSSGTASTTSATWLRRDSSTWTSGGDFNSTVLSSKSINPVTVVAGAVQDFDTSASFVAAAQAALDGGTSLSLLLKLNDTDEGTNLRRAFFFNSDDFATVANRPKLSIDYTPLPEPSAGLFTLLAGGLMLVCVQRRR